MYEFIQNNMIWIVPVVSIVLTVIIKISSKPSFCTLGFVDYLDFGFDLSISSIIVLLTGIHTMESSNTLGIWLILLSFMLIMIISIIVNRLGWDKDTEQIKLIGVLIPDIIGVALLIVSTLYVGGVIK